MQKGVVIHHSGIVTSKTSEAEQVRQINKIKNERYTYHYCITRDGQIIQIHKFTEVVGHAANQKLEGDIDKINRETIGICLLGNFLMESWTLKQIFAISYIIQFLRQQKLYDGRFYLHKEISYTDCPGELLKQIIEPFLKMEYREISTIKNPLCKNIQGKIFISSRLPELLGLLSCTLWEAGSKKLIFFR